MGQNETARNKNEFETINGRYEGDEKRYDASDGVHTK